MSGGGGPGGDDDEIVAHHHSVRTLRAHFAEHANQRYAHGAAAHTPVWSTTVPFSTTFEPEGEEDTINRADGRD
jgi:hypothetical protein